VAADLRMGDALSVGLDARAMVYGGRRQTVGLEDGASIDSTSALWGSLKARYQLTDQYGLGLRYRYSRFATDWSGASTRVDGAMATSRTDQAHLITVGVDASF
jgi:hypothetical protein